MRFNHLTRTSKGFTLVEVVISIVALSIALAVVVSFITPTEEQSADQIHQVKAAELAQAILDDIEARAFDHNSDMSGGRDRCNEAGQPDCTLEGDFGPEAGENSRSDYNDVDDFHGYNQLVNSLDGALDSTYSSFVINVNVTYDGIQLGLAQNNLAKRITVTVTTPLGTNIAVTRYRTNF